MNLFLKNKNNFSIDTVITNQDLVFDLSENFTNYTINFNSDSFEDFTISNKKTSLTYTDFKNANYIWFYLDRLGDSNLVTTKTNSNLDLFYQREWNASLLGLFLFLEKTLGKEKWINPPSLLYLNDNKFYLITEAQRQGLNVPSFMVSNFWQKQTENKILKTIHPNRIIDEKNNQAFANLVLTKQELNPLSKTKQNNPFFMQTIIDKVCEYRVYYLLGKIVLLRLTTKKDEINLNRLEMKDIDIEPITKFDKKAKEYINKLIDFCKKTGFNYCCFDILETKKDFYLIDINPNGSWHAHNQDNFVSNNFLKILNV